MQNPCHPAVRDGEMETFRFMKTEYRNALYFVPGFYIRYFRVSFFLRFKKIRPGKLSTQGGNAKISLACRNTEIYGCDRSDNAHSSKISVLSVSLPLTKLTEL